MKKTIRNIAILLVSALYSITCHAQNTEVLWGVSNGGMKAESANAIVNDNSGNIYVTGSFQGEAKFGQQTLLSNGDTDIFLAKYNSLGELVWVKKAGSNIHKKNVITEYGTNLTLVNNEYIYVTGVFCGNATFENYHIQSQSFIDDIFIAKYNLKGDLLWVKTAGGKNQDIPKSITHDNEGNIYITGMFQRNAYFDDKTISASGLTDTFLSKYSPEGNLIWIKQTNSNGSSSGKSIVCYKNHIYQAGEFKGNIKLNNKSILYSNGKSDIFITKYDLNGNLIWGKNIGGKGSDNITSISVENDKVYFAGTFSETLTTGGLSIESNGSSDIFFGKINSNSKIAWLKNLGGKYRDSGQALKIIQNNGVFISGYFQTEITAGEKLIKGNGFTDIILAKYDLKGNFLWANTYGGIGQDISHAIEYNQGEIILAGQYRNQMIIDNEKLNSKGSSDLFLMKIKELNTSNTGFDTSLKEINLYPNPARNDFTIEGKNNINEIRIFSVSGKLVYTKGNISSNKILIENLVLQSGVYLVKIKTSSQIFSKKLVINSMKVKIK